MHSVTRPWLALGSVLALAVAIEGPAVAGDGASFAVTQPLKRGQKPSGLQIDYRGWGWTGSGYREVEFEIRSVRTATRERTITIEAAPNSYHRADATLKLRKTVTLPKGHTRSIETMILPQHVVWNAMRVDVYEGRRRLEDVSMRTGTFIPTSFLSEVYPTMLVIDADAPPMESQASRIADLSVGNADGDANELPDVRSLAMLVHPNNNQDANAQRVRQMLLDPQKDLKRGTDLENLQFVSQAAQLQMIPPSDLPDSWLALSQVDVVFVSVDDLLLMLERQRARAEQLFQYITTGATLVVHGMGESHARRDELTEALQAGAVVGQLEWQELSADTRPDVSPEARENLQQIREQIEQYGQYVTTSPGASVRATASTAAQIPLQGPTEPLFLAAPLGLGRIVAVAGDEPFHGRSGEWHWLFAQLGPDRWMWYRRHGLSLQRQNPDYWNFLIPGLGAAPVKTFLLMITGFVVVVGPVNYWLLRRSGRIHLLLATVPAAAAALTLGMLAYVVLHDGFATRLRARSITHLDQQRGQAVMWARQSYYSGIAPTGGLRFPADAAVYPLHHRPNEAVRRPRALRWQDDQQLLESGYHRSRALTQLLVIRPQPSTMRLNVRRRANTDGLEVENQLGVPLEHLFVRDEKGELYRLADLADGGREPLVPCTVEEAQAALAPLMADTRPAVPDKFDIDYHTRSFGFVSWSYSWSVDEAFPEPTQATGILEKHLSAPPASRQPAKREFWAYSRTAPKTMPVGIDKVEQVAGLHLIQGEW